MNYTKRQALRIQKRARQRQRIALRIKQLRAGQRVSQNVFDSIFMLKQVSKNYPKF